MIAKKTGVICVVLLLVVSVIGVAVGFTGGGTYGDEVEANELTGDVIEVHTWEDLHNMRDDLAGNYRLMNDLTTGCEGYDDYASENADDGAGWMPIGERYWDGSQWIENPFGGSFDGQNHTIEGLYIDRPSTNYIGLFGFVDGGEVRNVGLVDADVSGNYRVGGLVGENNEGTVENSYTVGSVTGYQLVGGLVGENNEGTVYNSSAFGIVTGYQLVGGLVGENRGTIESTHTTGKVIADHWRAGGLVGQNHDVIKNSSSSCDVTGDRYVGGIVGQNRGDIEYCYATGTVSGSMIVGGFVGQASPGYINNSYTTGDVITSSGTIDVGGFAGRIFNPSIINCYSTSKVIYEDSDDPTDKGFVGNDVGSEYEMLGNFWDVEVSGHNSTVGNATGKTTPEMMNIDTFTGVGWDIVEVDTVTDRDKNHTWNIVDGESYPFLSWQEEVSEVLELTISVEGEGSTEPAEGTHTYFDGDWVTVTATPAQGWRFVEWTGDHESTEEQINVFMDTDRSITAWFEEKDEFELTIGVEGEGSTEPAEGTHTYFDGDLVTVTATPAQGWRFVEWTGDHEGTEEQTTVLMDANRSITAWFEERDEFELTIGVEGEGSTVPAEGTHTYSPGEEVTITATPAHGWLFVEWTGDHEGTEEQITVLMDDDRSITAHFSPFVMIYDVYSLQAINQDLYGYYALANDIDASETRWWNGGAGFEPLGEWGFDGILDGQGYEISGLYINRTDTYNIGLFGSSGGEVRNIGLTDIDVSGDRWVGGLVGRNSGTVNNSYAKGTVSGDDSVGGLMGDNTGTVNNSYATGTVSGTGSAVGGLVGYNTGTVNNSYATGEVSGSGRVGGLVGDNNGVVKNSYVMGTVSGDYNVGGLVGFNGWGSQGIVSNSYAMGTVSGSGRVGGLVGRNWDGAVVSNSYATGNVSGNTGLGGLVGDNNDGTVSNSFWDVETSGIDVSDGGTGLPTSQMKMESTFTSAGWDFDDIWWMIQHVTYPKLLHQGSLPPSVNIQSPAGGSYFGAEEVTVEWIGSGKEISISHYNVRINEGDWINVGQQITHTFSYLDEGNHTVDVMAFDHAGNSAMDSVTFIVDITPPEVEMISPDDGAVLDYNDVTVSWDGSDELSGIAFYEIRLNYGGWMDDPGTDTEFTFYGLNEWNYRVDVRATDRAGNRAEDSITFVVDTTEPIVAITAPSDGSYLSAEDVTIGWTGDGGASGIDYYEIRINENDWINKGTATFHDLTELDEGEHTVDVMAFNHAGNSAMDSVTFTVDLTPPEVEMISPDDGAVLDYNNVTVSWDGSDELSGIVLYEIRLNYGGWMDDPGTDTEFTFYGLNDFNYRVDVRATDRAGNRATHNITFTVDITPPEIEIISPYDGAVLDYNNVTVRWNGSDNLSGIALYEIQLNDGGWMDDPGTDAEFTFYGLDELSYRVDVRATDRAGNQAMHNISFTVDLSDPTMDIDLLAGGEADGWNFVSFNLIPTDTSLLVILEDLEYGISGNYDRVMWYDASQGEWLTYVPGRPDHFNDLDSWDNTMGIWIRVTEDATLTVEGSVLTRTNITLYSGWNMVGLPSESAGDHGLPPEVSRIGYFDASDEYNIEYTDDVAGFVFEPGQGYWVYNGADEPVMWTVDY